MYNFDESVERLNTNCVKWDIPGAEYLPLWVADMDFKVPPAVTSRLTKRIGHEVFGYAHYDEDVNAVLEKWFQDKFDAKIEKSWIKYLPSIVPALNVASNLNGKGASITNVPNYSCLLNSAGKAGNIMITAPMKNDNEYYSIDFDALTKALTPDTKVFYLCNPHNPVGRVYTYEELKAVSEWAKKNDLLVISDEAHCDLVFEGKHIPFFTVDDYAREHSLTFYSDGKMCNVSGLILAFAIIPNTEIKKEFDNLCYAFPSLQALNAEAGIACYAESDDWKGEMLEYLRANRDYLESELKQRFPKVKFVHLEATYLLWADFRAYGEDIDAKFFRDKAKVYLTDGAEFGGPGYVRINFATQRDNLREALDRMEKSLKQQGLALK